MSKDRSSINLRNPASIQRAQEGLAWVANGRLDDGWTLVLTRKRSDKQNARLWVVLGEIAKQRPVHHGARMSTDDYKILFVHGLRKESRFIPDLDGESAIPVTYSSSNLTVSEFSDLFEIIDAWCAREGIIISQREPDQTTRKAA
jgi:hypothetical protein